MAQRPPRRNAMPPGRRAAILDAAERLFAERGYDGDQPQRGRRRRRRLAGARRATSSAARPSSTGPCSSAAFAEVREAVRAGRARALASSQTRRGHSRRRRLRLLRLPRRPAQLRPADRARGPERRRPARGREPPLGRPGGARRDQRRARPRRRALGRRGPAPPQHHRALLVPPDPCPHRGARRSASSSSTPRRPRAPQAPRRGPGAARTSRARPLHGAPPSPRPRPMTDVLTPRPSRRAPPLATEQEAREVAEAAREKEWEAPSFVRELFEGSFRLDLVHPFPAMDPADLERARPFMERLERFLARAGGQRPHRPGGQDPGGRDPGTARHRRVRHQDSRGVRRPRPEPDRLHPRHRHGDQRGRQPHRAALRRAVDRRAAAAQAVRHAGAEAAVPAAPGQGARSARSRSPRRNVGSRPGRDAARPPCCRRTARTTSSTARSSGAPTAPSPS